MTTSAKAWLLTDSSGHTIAVADMETFGYLVEATVLEVPFSPDHCPAVLPWRNRLLPIVLLHRLFEPGAGWEPHHFAILAYQQRPGEALRYIALALGHPPQRILVSDQVSEVLPEEYEKPALQPLVRSVFRHDNSPVPVIDINYLASSTLSERLAEDHR